MHSRFWLLVGVLVTGVHGRLLAQDVGTGKGGGRHQQKRGQEAQGSAGHGTLRGQDPNVYAGGRRTDASGSARASASEPRSSS